MPRIIGGRGRVEHAGLVQRGTDQSNRSIVAVELTVAGRRLVTWVLAHRHARLATVLDRMSPADRAAAVRWAGQFARLSGDAVALGSGSASPLPPRSRYLRDQCAACGLPGR
jgi:hypothetical protein